ncbi:hypothetical protein GCM10010112_17580 [Actinoplanes lobatus]|uniref:DUF1707 domain-containing protein n=1 Tax=Actinoplanes lobatus TaxID=113568 RepID=A0A7W7MDZ0_9ACTN|nr:DUF1707 domain-containing protein [Actinoplanes lobatus]MBB4746280.1 hypothetical protein [Actinoplanes lobatus]GGN60922.1 hypothetical protein GCM10010112_17580 [Actinoplanes lobatus]GIE41170.1 hypothetical protein Alo02nite_40680 [Actinoplanes lobatus]
MTDPTLRASDAERYRVVAMLEKHAAAGRLTLDEFTERVDRVLACRTHGDLAAVTADLPASASPREEDNRHLLWAFLAAALVLVVFSVVLGLAR